jgi:hypothetical protein
METEGEEEAEGGRWTHHEGDGHTTQMQTHRRNRGTKKKRLRMQTTPDTRHGRAHLSPQ